MTELLRRSRRLEKYINNASNQLVEEFQSRNVHVLHSQTSESHESRELVLLSLCLWLVRVFVSAVDIFSFSRTFPFHEWFDSLFSASECKHSERDQMKIKSDQRSPDRDWGSGLRPHFLHLLAIFKRDGIPLMQSWVTAIPGSQAGQYRVKCIARAPTRSESGLHRLLYLRHFLLNQQMGCERERERLVAMSASPAHHRGSRNNIQRAPDVCRARVSPGPIYQLLLANRGTESADS